MKNPGSPGVFLYAEKACGQLAGGSSQQGAMILRTGYPFLPAVCCPLPAKGAHLLLLLRLKAEFMGLRAIDHAH
jgi:hypothetical protein